MGADWMSRVAGALRVHHRTDETMTLQEISNQTAVKILALFKDQPSASKAKEIELIVDTAVFDAAVSMRQSCAKVVKFHAGAEADIAHKIDENLRRMENALIENLKAMR